MVSQIQKEMVPLVQKIASLSVAMMVLVSILLALKVLQACWGLTGIFCRIRREDMSPQIPGKC